MSKIVEHWKQTARLLVRAKTVTERRAILRRAETITPVDELTAERDALAAMVEVLRAEMEFSATKIVERTPSDEVRALACSIIDAARATPQQCLAEIRTEAVVQAIQFFKPARDIDAEALEAYAAKMRKGGA